jgi:hypothetical protein
LKWHERKIVPIVAVEKYHQKGMYGSATSVGLNFQEKVEEEHPEKKGGNGDDNGEFYRACARKTEVYL